MGKKLYTGFSTFNFIGAIFLRLLLFAAVLYAAIHFNQNPVVVTIFCLFCLIGIMIAGSDKIVIYKDKIIHTTDSYYYYIFKKEGKIIELKDVKLAYLQPLTGDDSIGLGAIILVSLISRNSSRNQSNYIYFELKNGKTEHFSSGLERDELHKIVSIIKVLAERE